MLPTPEQLPATKQSVADRDIVVADVIYVGFVPEFGLPNETVVTGAVLSILTVDHVTIGSTLPTLSVAE